MKYIKLTKGAVAIVCDCHADLVAINKWYFDNHYAHRKQWLKDKKKYIGIRMHQVICPAPKGMDVDHINGNKLDNRCDNLRVITRSENIYNKRYTTNRSSKYRGVSFDKYRNKWKAYLTKNNKHIQIGRFNTEIEAALAYNNKAIEIFKTDKWCNIIES